MTDIATKLLEADLSWVGGFLTTGVILVLVGVKNVTSKDLKEYKRTHSKTNKWDEWMAWGVFYIVFGVLISASALLPLLNLYLR